MRFLYLTIIFASILVIIVQKSQAQFNVSVDNMIPASQLKDIIAANPNNTDAKELLLVIKEFERSNEMFDFLKTKGVTIRGFYHTSSWRNHWKEVITEQLRLLDGDRKVPISISSDPLFVGSAEYKWDTRSWTSLLNATEELYINVAGNENKDFLNVQRLVNSLNLRSRDKIKLHYSATVGRMTYREAKPERKKELDESIHLTEGEVSTVFALHDYCVNTVKEGKKALVYYLHSKGSCCIRPGNGQYEKSVASWREEMNTFNIEFPSICIRALNRKGYSACGADNQDAHFSGNFWWADCNHIAALPRQWDRFDAYQTEYYVLNVSDWHVSRQFGFQCAYTTHKCPLNHYDFECPRSDYRDKLLQYVDKTKLLPSSLRGKKGNDTKICRDLKKDGRSYSIEYD
eukprot:gene6834-9356_t